MVLQKALRWSGELECICEEVRGGLDGREFASVGIPGFALPYLCLHTAVIGECEGQRGKWGAWEACTYRCIARTHCGAGGGMFGCGEPLRLYSAATLHCTPSTAVCMRCVMPACATV